MVEHKMIDGEMSEWCRIKFESWCKTIPNLWRYEEKLTEIETNYPQAMSTFYRILSEHAIAMGKVRTRDATWWFIAGIIVGYVIGIVI